MRDFRDAKAMARTIRADLAENGLKISVGQSLELVAKAFGLADWNTLSAAILAEPRGPRENPSSAPAAVAERPPQAGRVGFAAELESTLHRAVADANRRSHEYATLEHLLLALMDDADAAAVLRGCKVPPDKIKTSLADHLGREPRTEPSVEARPTAGFQRVIQRAVLHVQASGRQSADGAQVLVAIFSEPESRAAQVLGEHGLNRAEAVIFMKNRDAAV